MINYRSNLHFVPVQWFLAELWTLKFGQIFSCHHFFSLCLEIWFLVYECIIMSYRSSLHFVPVQWFLALGLWNLAKYSVVTTFFRYDLRLWLDFWFECIMISYRWTLKFIPVEWFLANLQLLGFEILTKYLIVTTYFSIWYEILTWFFVWEFKEAWGYRS